MLSKVEILQRIKKYLDKWKEDIISNHERAGQVASGKTKKVFRLGCGKMAEAL